MDFQHHHSFNGHSGAVYALCTGEDDDHFFSASGDRYVVSWNSKSFSQEKFAVRCESPVYSVFYSRKHALLFAGLNTGAFHVIDHRNRKEIRLLNAHSAAIFDIREDEERHLLYVAGGDGVLSVWSLPDLRLIRNIPVSAEKLRKIAIRQDGTVALACADGNVRILENEFYNEVHTLKAHAEGSTSVAWHPDKPALVSGGKDAWLRVWNSADQFRNALEIPAHNFAIYSIAFHAEKKICATASRDKSIKIWDSGSFDPLQKLEARQGGHSHSVNSLIWQGDLLISCGDDKKIILWKKR